MTAHDPTALVAEWTAAMEGVPDGPWTHEPWHVSEGPPTVYVKDGWLLCAAPADDHARWIARCSPAGIAPLLALLAQQAATTEAVTKERDELRDFGGSAVETAGRILEFLGIGQDASKEPGTDRRRDRLAAWIDKAAEARATAAEAERDRLREALEPLAKAADIHDAEIESEGVRPDCVEDDWPIDPINKLGSTPCLCTVGDLRRARAALSTAKEQTDV